MTSELKENVLIWMVGLMLIVAAVVLGILTEPPTPIEGVSTTTTMVQPWEQR